MDLITRDPGRAMALLLAPGTTGGLGVGLAAAFDRAPGGGRAFGFAIALLLAPGGAAGGGSGGGESWIARRVVG